MKKKKKIIYQATAKLARLLHLEFATINADDGTTLYIDGDVQAGAAVYVLTEPGDYQIAPDGTYVSEGVTYVVSNGSITSVSPDASTEMEVEVEEATEATGEVTAEDHNDLVEVVNDLIDIIREQDEEIENLNETVVALETEFRKATTTTNGRPAKATTSFNKSARSKSINFADQKMKKLIQNFK